jgi:hypothetical protein
MKADKLAAALMRDRERPSKKPSSSIDCFLCGNSFTYRYRAPQGDASGRFCSDKCREAYDAGYRRAEPVDAFKSTSWRLVAGGDPGYLPSTPMRRRPVGWYLTCLGCQRDFESKGLRYCSTECERRSRERQENAELMAEVGMEVEAKPVCSMPSCKNPIPKWRNGRRVSKRARFCDRHSRLSRKSGRRERVLGRKNGAPVAE